MAKIMLFGSSTIVAVPQNIVDWLYQYTQQGHEFIVGDCKGADTAFHKALSSVGASDKSTIYCMGNPRNNIYEFKTRIFDTYYDSDKKQVEVVLRGTNEGEVDESFEPIIIEGVAKEIDIQNTRQWYELKDRQMINDCDMAIALWNGESKGTMHCIQLLGIYNKPCYTIKI